VVVRRPLEASSLAKSRAALEAPKSVAALRKAYASAR
jgi:hypothetical protein